MFDKPTPPPAAADWLPAAGLRSDIRSRSVPPRFATRHVFPASRAGLLRAGATSRQIPAPRIRQRKMTKTPYIYLAIHTPEHQNTSLLYRKRRKSAKQRAPRPVDKPRRGPYNNRRRSVRALLRPENHIAAFRTSRCPRRRRLFCRALKNPIC